MSLELFGFIKDLVASNPLGTDPKSEGDDHLRGLKSTLKAQFSGFTQGKAITLTEDQINSRHALTADNATNASLAANSTLLAGQPPGTGPLDIAQLDANGKLPLGIMPTGGASFAAKGYADMIGGLIIQWGNKVTSSEPAASIDFGKPFPNACFAVVTSGNPDASTQYPVAITFISAASFIYRTAGNGPFYWVAVGY
jgi:hypothetical protein